MRTSQVMLLSAMKLAGGTLQELSGKPLSEIPRPRFQAIEE